MFADNTFHCFVVFVQFTLDWKQNALLVDPQNVLIQNFLLKLTQNTVYRYTFKLNADLTP